MVPCRPVIAALALLLAVPAGAQTPPTLQAPTLQAPTLPQAVERATPAETPRLRPAEEPAIPEPRRGPGEDRIVRIARAALTDATVLTPEAVRATLDALAGREVPLRAVEEARVAILGAFRRAGYPFVAVNATLAPAANGEGLDLRFSAVEGFVSEIRLDGDIGPAATQALRFAGPLRDLGPLSSDALERALLLVSDIPGVTVRGVLQPVEGAPGALRLLLQLERQPVSGLLTLDNRAFRLTGPFQSLATIGANAFTEYGERTEITLYGTEALSQRFVQASTEAFIGGSGLRLRIFGGYGESEPRGFLAALGFQGTSTVAGIVATYPIIRSRALNLTATAGFDAFEGTVDADRGTLAAHDSVRAVRGGLTAAALDPVPLGPFGTGLTSGTVRLHGGVGDEDAASSRAGATGRFVKVTGELQRDQPLAEPLPGLGLSLQLSLAGQWSPDVLPASEKFLLGGGRITRGYYAGQAAGDSAWTAGAELRLDRGFDVPSLLGLPAARVGAQAYLFHDRGRAIQNTPAERDVGLSSVGGGLRLFVNRSFQIEGELARRLERRPDGAATAPIAPWAAFLGAVVRF